MFIITQSCVNDKGKVGMFIDFVGRFSISEYN